MRGCNFFSGPYLDRMGHVRPDGDWFASALSNPASRAVPVWNLKSLITDGEAPRAGTVELERLPIDARSAGELILLGRSGEQIYFAVEMRMPQPPALLADARFHDLRQMMARLPAEDAGILAYARAMISWRRNHRFCGLCGARTRAVRGGHVLACESPQCKHEQFPRLDPAIIVLVSDGGRALLGRQAAWPSGRYSTIAGFVEPGESLEDAVAREVHEETGIEVDRIEYHSSQPWPFPSSLMLGFTARAASSEIRLNDRELEDARWFTREDLIAGRPLLPPRHSISFSLIENWFDGLGNGRLREIAGDSTWPTPR